MQAAEGHARRRRRGFPGPLASVTGGAAGPSLTTSSRLLLALRSAPFAADDVVASGTGRGAPPWEPTASAVAWSVGPLVGLVALGGSKNSFGGSVGACAW